MLERYTFIPIVCAISFVCICGVPNADASQGRFPWPYLSEISFDTAAARNGKLVGEIRLTRMRDCGEFTFSIASSYNVDFQFDTAFTAPSDSIYTIKLSGSLMPNDTSGFDFTVTTCGMPMLVGCYWIIMNDRVEHFPGNPKQRPEAMYPRNPNRKYIKPDSIVRMEAEQRRIEDSIWRADSIRGMNPPKKPDP